MDNKEIHLSEKESPFTSSHSQTVDAEQNAPKRVNIITNRKDIPNFFILAKINKTYLSIKEMAFFCKFFAYKSLKLLMYYLLLLLHFLFY